MQSPLDHIDHAQAVLVDLDGCFLMGDILAPGAKSLFERCADRLFVVSNNSTLVPMQMAKLLAAQGIFLAPDRILLAGALMVDMVAARYSGKQVLMLCGVDLQEYALSKGLLLDDGNPELVMMGRDTNLSYKRLSDAVNALEEGLPLLVANPDLTHPGENNRTKPETGALLAAVQAMVPAVRPEIIGKPGPLLFQAALQRGGARPDMALMLGDNPDTDLAGAVGMGIATYLVGSHGLAAAPDIHSLLAMTSPNAPHVILPHCGGEPSRDPGVVHSLFDAIENMGEALAIWDVEDHLIYCNHTYTGLFNEPEKVKPGIRFAELVEMNIRTQSLDGIVWREKEISKEALTPEIYRKLRMQCHQDCSEMLQINRHNGQWLQVRESRTFDGGVVGIYTDITDRKYIEAQLAEAKAAAEEASLAKSRLLAAASHDLRQPLHAIGIFLSALGALPLSDEVRKIVANIEGCLHSTNSLFHSLLDISKLDAGVVHPEPRPIALAGLLRSLQREFEPSARQRGLELHVVVSTVTVKTDMAMLGRIVRNFVSNAIKYTDSGRILVGVRRRKKEVRIDVCDTGIGFPTRYLQRIFKAFERLDSETGPREGLGLGLSIAARLASLLEHRIDVHSIPGKGSRFSIHLPRIEVDSFFQPGASPHLLSDPHRALAGTRVLLVDDDRDICSATELLLRQWGCGVWTAASAPIALDRIRRHQWLLHIIVADYHLGGGISGKQLLIEIRELLGSDLPAVMITGDTTTEGLREMNLPNCPILHKPLQPLRLRAALQQFCLNADSDWQSVSHRRF